MRRAAVVALLGALCACNGGVHDLADEPVVFGTLHVRLDAELAALVATSTGSFRVGVLWAGSPVFIPYCSLSGCDDSVDCINPDWDVRDNPPDWWRCGR